MVRAGISLPALQHLMGHSQIHTTHAVCPTCASGRLARICPRRRKPGALGPPRRYHESAQTKPRTDLRNARPDPCSDAAVPYRQKLSLRLPAASWVILAAPFRRVRRLSQIRRDPHMLGWFRWLCDQDPPLCNHTREEYLLCLRRLLDDLAFQGHSIQPGLILREDFPSVRNISPGLCRRKMINGFKRNCAEQTTSIPMLSC